MWYLVYEDYDDFFFGEKAPVKMPEKFSTLDEVIEFAKKNSMEVIKKDNNVLEVYLKNPEYTARYEFYEQ